MDDDFGDNSFCDGLFGDAAGCDGDDRRPAIPWDRNFVLGLLMIAGLVICVVAAVM